MAYVMTETQSHFVRSERDLAGFEAAYLRRVDRVVESMVAPQRTEQHRDERGRPFTCTPSLALCSTSPLDRNLIMLELRHYIDRSLVGFILLAVVALTLLSVLVPIITDTIEAARTLSDAISSGAILTN